MTKLPYHLGLAAAATLLAGCSTPQSEFFELTPEQRGIKVCHASKQLRFAIKSCERYLKDIPAVEETIKRGYTTTKECAYEEVEDGTDEYCWPLANGGKQCKKVPRYKAVEKCTEIKNDIDVAAEKDRIRSMHEAKENCDNQMRFVVQTCIEQAGMLPPEEAFALYQKGLRQPELPSYGSH